MAGLLSSWWGSKPEEKTSEGGEEGAASESEKGKEEGSWVAGFEGNVKTCIHVVSVDVRKESHRSREECDGICGDCGRDC